MRYEVGEYVIYGNNGICQVLDITTPGFSGVDKEKMYYVLEPVHTKGSRIYSPVDSHKVVMRAVIDEEQAEESLYSELGFALGKEKDEMETYITERIHQQKQ